MRVTEYGSLLVHLYHLGTNQTDQDRLQLELSSGRRLNKDSDNPLDSSESHAVRREAAYIGMFRDNVNRATAVINFADATLNSATQLIYRAQQISEQAASNLLNDADRNVSADTLLNIRDELLTLANSSYQGEYVFAGAQNDKKPYVYVDPADPNNANPDPKTSYVVFRGDNNGRQVPVSNQMTLQDTISGMDVFHTDTYPSPTPSPVTAPSNPQDLFEVLRKMAEAVRGGNIQKGSPQFKELWPLLEKGREAISSARSTLGTRMNMMEDVTKELTDQTDQLTIRASKLEDADVAKDIMDLSLRRSAMQTTLYAQANIMKQTLFDYIG